MTYQSLNPFDGALIENFSDLSDVDFELKLAAAQTCFEKWRHISYADRAVIIAKAADLLDEQSDAFARTMTLEMGKRIGEARGEVAFSARILRYYAKNAEHFSLRPNSIRPLAKRIWKVARSASSSALSLGISHITSLPGLPVRT